MKDLKLVIREGRENRLSKKQLMQKAEIEFETFFTHELAKVKREKIVLFDDGYYYPNTKEEYVSFIKETKRRIKEYEILKERATKEIQKFLTEDETI